MPDTGCQDLRVERLERLGRVGMHRAPVSHVVMVVVTIADECGFGCVFSVWPVFSLLWLFVADHAIIPPVLLVCVDMSTHMWVDIYGDYNDGDDANDDDNNNNNDVVDKCDTDIDAFSDGRQ